MSHDPTRVVCPECQARLRVATAAADEKLTCPKCGAVFLPPAVSAQPQAVAGPEVEWDDLFGPAPTPAPVPGVPQLPQVAAPTSVAAAGLDPDAPLPFDDEPDEIHEPAAPATASTPLGDPFGGTLGAPLSSQGDDDLDGFRLEPPVPMPKATTATRAEVADRFTFGVHCPTCGTRIDCLSTEIGQPVKCPDCYKVFPLPQPHPSVKRTPVDDRTAKLDEQAELAPADESTANARSESRDVIRAHAADLLARAKAEQEAAKDDVPREFENSQAVAIFRFLFAPDTIARCVLLMLVGMLVLVMLRTGVPALFETDARNIYRVGVLGGAGFMLSVWLAVLLTHGQALFRDTAYENAAVEWPGPLDFLSECWYPLVGIIFAALPGSVLAWVLTSLGLPLIVGILLAVMSWVLLFPPTFLSMMQEVSLVALVSLRVYRTMTDFRGPWLVFYQATALLGLILFGLLMVAFEELKAVVPLVAVGVTFVMLMYFRVLGWLASQIAPGLSDELDESPTTPTTPPAAKQPD